MSHAWMTADSQNNCFMLCCQLGNGILVGRGSDTKTVWNWPSGHTTSQLTSGKHNPGQRASVRKGTKQSERNRLQRLYDKRLAQKNRVLNPNTAVPCQLCGNTCASTFGLQAHMCKQTLPHHLRIQRTTIRLLLRTSSPSDTHTHTRHTLAGNTF